ncbi:MAG: tetratricopeptide repeat protein [Elusimicrobia bacterium]|nr:tetratricopeptide repeat protein [Elusimicrobiota bacterium]
MSARPAAGSGLFEALRPLVRAGRLPEAAAELRRLAGAGACRWEAYIWKGRIEEKLARFADAERAFRQVLGAPDSRGEPEMEYARFLEMRGRLEEAQTQLRAARRRAGPVFEIHLGLGRLSEKLGRCVRAGQEFRKAVAARPDSALPVIGLARVLIKTGRLVGAERLLWRALELGGPPGEARLLLGQVLAARGRGGSSETQLRRAAQAEPGSLPAQLELARALDRSGRPGAARTAFRRAAAAAAAAPEVRPEWPEVFSALLCAGSHDEAFRLGEAMLGRSAQMAYANSFLWPWWYGVSPRLGREKESFCRRELGRLRGAGTHPHWRAYCRGVLAISLARDRQARAEYESIRRLPMRRYACLHHPFVAHLMMAGRFAESDAICRAVLREVPEYWWFQCRLGESLLAQGDRAAGLREFAQAGRTPDLVARQSVLTWHGEALLWLGRYRAALEKFRQASGLGARTWVDCWRGAARLRLGDVRAALADLDRAVARDPQDLEAYVWRGEARRLLGRHAEARRDLDRAVALDGNYAWAYCNRALVRQALGDEAGMAADFAAIPPRMTRFLRRRLGLPEGGVLSPARMRAVLLAGLELAKGIRRPEPYLNPVWMGRRAQILG